MKLISLDASKWAVPLDFYEDVLLALEAPTWHGLSLDAFVDSMVYGEVNGIDPPYRLAIDNTGSASNEILTAILDFKSIIEIAMKNYNSQDGSNVPEIIIDVR